MRDFTWPQVVVLLLGFALVCIPWIASVLCFVLFPALVTADHIGVAAIGCLISSLFAGDLVLRILSK